MNAEVPVEPLCSLAPWVLFGIAAGLKFWQLATLVRRQVQGAARSTERFRQSLERNWRKQA